MSRKGWLVTFSAMGLNLALGVLYSWSVFAKQFTEAIDTGGFGWSKTTAALPYTIAIAFNAAIMLPAGHLQDKFGPRIVATVGALLVGLGLVVTSFASPGNILPALIGFGAMTGTGIGLGYSTTTPAAVKWSPPEQRGLITGIVVSGFGLASVYIAPISKYLLVAYGVRGAFLFLGIGFTVITSILAQFINNPSTPAVSLNQNGSKGNKVDYSWSEMVRTRTFYLLWIEFACGAMAGLMIIGHLAKIVSDQSGNVIKIGFVFVALLAIYNAAGRIIAGLASDYIGRLKTILIICLSQAVVMFFFSKISTATTFVLGSAVLGFGYGACLSLFPSACADFWGRKNLGLNYGILFTAWGVGGVFGPILAGKIADASGNYNTAYIISAALMILAAFLTFFTKAPEKETAKGFSQPVLVGKLQA